MLKLPLDEVQRWNIFRQILMRRPEVFMSAEEGANASKPKKAFVGFLMLWGLGCQQVYVRRFLPNPNLATNTFMRSPMFIAYLISPIPMAYFCYGYQKSIYEKIYQDKVADIKDLDLLALQDKIFGWSGRGLKVTVFEDETANDQLKEKALQRRL